MRLKLISCEVLYREMCAAAARSPHHVDVEFLPIGLHALGSSAMRQRLQDAAASVDPTRYDAIALGYALCGNGIAGLASHALPLVIPRAHDCIALLLGSRERYAAYFETHSGVYFRSPGWLEHGQDLEQTYSLDELIARYGEDDGRYLFGQFTGYQRSYQQLTYIATTLEPDFEKQAREEAARRGWRFESIPGDSSLLDKLLAGDWDERDFLLLPPGWRVKPTYDAAILDKEPAT